MHLDEILNVRYISSNEGCTFAYSRTARSVRVFLFMIEIMVACCFLDVPGGTGKTFLQPNFSKPSIRR